MANLGAFSVPDAAERQRPSHAVLGAKPGGTLRSWIPLHRSGKWEPGEGVSCMHSLPPAQVLVLTETENEAHVRENRFQIRGAHQARRVARGLNSDQRRRRPGRAPAPVPVCARGCAAYVSRNGAARLRSTYTYTYSQKSSSANRPVSFVSWSVSREDADAECTPARRRTASGPISTSTAHLAPLGRFIRRRCGSSSWRRPHLAVDHSDSSNVVRSMVEFTAVLPDRTGKSGQLTGHLKFEILDF